jgi:hypothetical protein
VAQGAGPEECGATFFWSYAGQLFTLKQDQGRVEAAAPNRRTAPPQIVFIGIESYGFNEERIRTALDACLLTEDEAIAFCACPT